MGWKGTLRSINAAANRAERASKRRQRELERHRKALDKMRELDQAAYEVEEFENYLEVIQSLHTDWSETIDWQTYLRMKCPVRPEPDGYRENQARQRRGAYKPSWIDKLLKRIDKKIAQLDSEIEKSIYDDANSYKAALISWETSINEWKEDTEHAKKVLSGDAKARLQVLKEADPFSEIGALGSEISFNILSDGTIEANINIHSNDIVPRKQKALLKSGRMTIKDMPTGRFNEIYQDYVCSAALRVAQEIFALLPDQTVLINAQDDLLDSATGHLALQTILSVFVSRATLHQLNMKNIDPSDSMKNFLHSMNFRKNTGFSPVEIIGIPESVAV